MRLVKIRKRIDEIDVELVELIKERTNLALKAGTIKQRMGLPLYDAKREEDVLRKVGELADDVLPAATIIRFFRLILSESLAHQIKTVGNEWKRRVL